jgi:hypothetical protein
MTSGAFTVHVSSKTFSELVFRASVTKNGIPYRIGDYLERQTLPKDEPKPPPKPMIYCVDLLDFQRKILIDLFNIQRKMYATAHYMP